MSIVLITHHDESIYQSTKISIKEDKKEPKYISKFRKVVPMSSKEMKEYKKSGVLGIPRQPAPNPLDFRKKGTWKAPLIPCTPEELAEINSYKPTVHSTVPKREEVLKEQDEKLKHKKKNMIGRNVRFVMNMIPKEPEKNVVLDRTGTKKNLRAGLEPVCIRNTGFGRTPKYLKDIIKTREQSIQENKDKGGLMQPKCKYMTRENREKLLTGLKQNWAELQKQYQGLPILTDTIPKKNRKTKFETDLRQLEKDIVLIERHPYIYVYNDDDIS